MVRQISDRLLSLIATALLTLAVVPSCEAQVNTGNAPGIDAAYFVTHAVEAFNNNTGRFQALRLGLDDMAPLEPASLDTNQIYEHLQSLLHYQQFLEAFRQQNTTLLHKLSDSVDYLEARLGDSARWHALDNFWQDFKHQASIFVEYSLKSSNYVLAVRSALVYLQNAGFDLKDGIVHVHGGSDSQEQYAALVNKARTAKTAMQEAYQTTIDDVKGSNELVKRVVDQLAR